MPIYVALTEMNGSKLRDVLFMVVHAKEQGEACVAVIKELMKSGKMSKQEATKLFNSEFLVQEMTITEV